MIKKTILVLIFLLCFFKSNSQNYDKIAIEILKQVEGLRLTKYKDSKHKYAIGYGHVLLKNEKYTKITKKKALELLIKDYFKVKKKVVKNFPNLVKHQNKIASLCLTTYNLGTKFHHKSLGLLVNKNNNEYGDSLLKYVYAGKKKLRGLQKRRILEKQLYYLTF